MVYQSCWQGRVPNKEKRMWERGDNGIDGPKDSANGAFECLLPAEEHLNVTSFYY